MARQNQTPEVIPLATPFWADRGKSTPAIARELLGCLLVHETTQGVLSGWIVETEAYLGVKDRAAHVYGGKHTPALDAFYHEAGTLYLYTIHGHVALNIITQSETDPEGVLIRAVEPELGVAQMRAYRRQTGPNLTNGPGKLTEALAIEKAPHYGTSILQPPLSLAMTARRVPQAIETTARIGVPNKGEWTEAPLRYYVRGNPYVSKTKKSSWQSDHGWVVTPKDHS